MSQSVVRKFEDWLHAVGVQFENIQLADDEKSMVVVVKNAEQIEKVPTEFGDLAVSCQVLGRASMAATPAAAAEPVPSDSIPVSGVTVETPPHPVDPAPPNLPLPLTPASSDVRADAVAPTVADLPTISQPVESSLPIEPRVDPVLPPTAASIGNP